MKNNKIWLILFTTLVVIIVGVAAFLGGMQLQKSNDKSSAANSVGGGFQNASASQRQAFAANGGGRSGGFDGLSGQIASVGTNTVTITTSSGSTEVVNLDSSTTVASETTATASDLVVGKTITITPNFGNNSSDNTTITARRITITN
ncbi:MAG TPA: hypothetical protein VMR51_02020 [Patescibacteria group bacterium]|nr:hypothetical protein [Patescibacteria group bacterium]